MKVITTFILVFSFTFGAFPQKEVKKLQANLNKILSNDFFKSSMISVDVYDLTAREYLFRKNIDMLLSPASNLKILTTMAGLIYLGPDYNFTTALYYTGQITGGTLYGDLYIVGGFDPAFTTSHIDTLISGLKGSGINNIVGNIYGDVSAKDSLFWGAGWMWDDDPSTDAPYLSSLSINENSVKIVAKPGEIDSVINVEVIPNSDFFKIQNTAITTAGDSSGLKVTRDWINRSNKILVSGYIPAYASPDTIELNVYDPAHYFLTLFKEGLFRNHILFNGITDTLKLNKASYLVSLYKRPLRNVIKPLLKKSINLFDELILYSLSEKYFGIPASARNGIKMIDSLIVLVGKTPKNYRIVDGSGVSHYNLVTSDLLLEVLKYIYYKQPDLFDLFYNSLPIAGVDGTLKNRMKGTKAENNIHAKTGTLSGVSCLSGYITSENGHNLAFSIMIQNYVSKAKVAKGFEDEICKVLAEY